jgi:hypothetical protein
MGADPTFLGVGVLKAGTTLLHTWLAEHPQVCVPPDRKEVRFFDKYYDHGMDWYRGLFQPLDERAVGEFSLSYLGSDTAMRRIADHLPDVKCIVSLRDPVKRFDSQYRHYAMVTGYRGSRGDFQREHPNAIERGRYAPQLERLLGLFPAEQVKVFIFEEFVRDPAAAVRALYTFVGVDPAHRPATLHERVNPTVGVRWPALWLATKRVSAFATERDLRWLLRVGRRLPIGRALLSERSDSLVPPPMGGDEAVALRRFYQEDIGRSSEILGRDLGALWAG